MEDGAARYLSTRHLLEAQRLRCNLQVVVSLPTPRSVFVLHRERTPVGREFHEVGLADEAEPVTPERHASFDTNRTVPFRSGFIHQTVDRPSAGGIQILRERLLDVNQRALARAIAPVLQGRNRHQIAIAHLT